MHDCAPRGPKTRYKLVCPNCQRRNHDQRPSGSVQFPANDFFHPRPGRRIGEPLVPGDAHPHGYIFPLSARCQ
ncbi:hypothetical protein SBA6_670016 [Candidatus Sulfopaludibacter sp. SbA6]|nr:hypothetical protein SBA6_670016 [Candidatus Sulfopaludibacter sp. SbA6]